MEKLILIDGNSLINRAFYATPLSMTDSKGNYTNAVYGFFNMLFKIIKEKSPTHMAIAFDTKAPTFRHKMYAEYKGTRKGMPEELRGQFPIVKEILQSMEIAQYECAGLEADDLLGTIATQSKLPVEVITGDNDYLQLISENVVVSITKKGITELESYTPDYLMEKMQLSPWQIVEMKSLMGDSSDNIPGVAGVGEKTAQKLLIQYGKLENIYENIECQKGKLKERLEKDEEIAYLSRELAKINTDADFSYDYADMDLNCPFKAEANAKLMSYQLKNIANKSEFFLDCNGRVEENQVEEEKIPNVVIKEISQLPIPKGDFCVNFGDSVEIFDGETNYVAEISQDMFGINFYDVLNALKPALENESQEKSVYDYKKIKHMLKDNGISLAGVKYDVMLMQYVAEFVPNIRSLADLAQFVGISTTQSGYAIEKIKNILLAKLVQEGTDKLYFDMELPLADVLFDMECAGFSVDEKKLSMLGEEYREKTQLLEKDIYQLAGKTFNINSPKQLSQILFEELGLQSGKKTKTGKSTGMEVLEEISDSHPIVPKILEYRKYSKLLSTYVDGMKTQIEEDGKIRTVFFQALTSTGRLSSREPNLQNIPVRTEEGKILRSVFLASEGCNLISADYSQIELRLLAHFSGDETLIEAFRNGKDIHRATASKVFKVAYEEVSQEDRRLAKAVNFGIVYGISGFGLAKQLGILAKQANEFIDSYFAEYANVKEYMNQNVENAKQKGYAQTYTGRKRGIPQINSSNYNLRSFGERAAMNMPLQGSASDIIKIAMIKVAKSLKDRGLKAKLILQVHDELIVDTPQGEEQEVMEILKKDMQDFQFQVPMNVEIAYGKNWQEAK